MNILCIEDNKQLVKTLQDSLGSHYQIGHATTGKKGMAMALEHDYEAIVLDLGLPDIGGMDVCLTLRRAKITTPILILSGIRDATTKVTLLEAGADDYMVKPFSVAELRARLFALLRRNNPDADTKYVYLLKIENLVLDPIARHVERSGKKIELRRKEFDILEYLMLNRDRIITRSMIMENVWDSGSSSWDGTVNVHIKNLRDRVDRPFKHKLIKTAYGLGYTINDKP